MDITTNSISSRKKPACVRHKKLAIWSYLRNAPLEERQLNRATKFREKACDSLPKSVKPRWLLKLRLFKLCVGYSNAVG
jgi:hypothetical protein